MDLEKLDDEFNEEVEDFEKMLNESFKNDDSNDKLIEGVIVKIDDSGVLVDVGTKVEGRISIEEIKDKDGNLLFKEGDKIEVLQTGSNGERPSISYKKAQKRLQKEKFIKENKDNLEGMVINGVVTKKNRGGYIVESDKIEFFLPKSLSAFREKDKILNKKVEAKIIKLDDNTNSIVISRKAILNEKKKAKKELLKRLMDNKEVVIGEIRKIKTYGMFVDVGGLEGLVHYSEISYKGPVNPATLYQEGDKVEVVATDYANKKLSLSIKAVQPDPWQDIAEQLEEGDAIQVTVSNIEPYGVFVDLGNEIEGFLHISELSWEKNIKHPADIVKVGDEIDTEVIELDVENRKLRVSLKKLQPKPFEEFVKKYKKGDVVKGKITTITDFGAFVKIDNIEGLLHNEDASWNNKKCKELFKVGDEVEVGIVKIEPENERVSLSRKILEKSPIELYAQSHNVGDVVNGKVLSIKDFGVFVKLDENVDGLIRKEDLYPKKVEDINVADEIEAVISFVDAKKGKIRLSVKKLEKQKEKDVLKKYNASENEKSTLGDVLKDVLKQ